MDYLKISILCVSLILISFNDIKTRKIYNKHSISLYAIGLFFSILNASYIDSIFGAFVGLAVINIVAKINHFLHGRERIGGGDALLIMAIGSFLGVEGTLIVCCFAPIFSAIYSLLTGATSVAYAPFISIATFLYIIKGVYNG